MLNTHIRVTHTDEKRHYCETCGKAFKIKSQLVVHQRVHSLEKPFVCSTCGKRFRQEFALKRHYFIHTGEQPYECSVCKMRFNQSSSMKRHLLIHTGEKPYSCGNCGMRFTQSGGLISHRLRPCPERVDIDNWRCWASETWHLCEEAFHWTSNKSRLIQWYKFGICTWRSTEMVNDTVPDNRFQCKIVQLQLSMAKRSLDT